MAETSETTPAGMYFDNTYQAWLANGTNNPANGIVTAGIVTLDGVSVTNPAVDASDAQIFFGRGSISSNNRPGSYIFKNAGNSLTVTLPKKDGYDLNAVGVVTAHYPQTYQNPFNYSYSTDGDSYVNITDTSYTSAYVSKVKNYLFAYYETVKVPADAKYLKITRNSNEVAIYGTEERSYPGVMGFSFGYLPTTIENVIKITAANNTEIMSLMTSGMVADGNNNFFATTLPYTVDGVKQYGLAVANNEEMVFNAIEGYKITKVEADFYNSNHVDRSLSIKLGNETITQAEASASLEHLSVISKIGEDSFSVLGAYYNPGALYNIEITMQKVGAVKPEGDTAISASVNGTIATATVTNLGAAPHDTMMLIIVGYNGKKLTNSKIITVYKEDIDGIDTVTLNLHVDTERVKAFLWKDFETLAPILDSVPEVVVSSSN